MPDKFPAKVIPNGNSKSITIPYNVAENYQLGDKVEIIIKKVKS